MNDLDPAPMTAAERDAAWRSILAELEPAPRSRRRLVAVPAALAVAASAVVALLPGDTPNRSLGTASAAEVLRAAAAASDLGAPGPGEVLFEQQRRVVPMGGGQADSVTVTRNWTAPDGSGHATIVVDEPGSPPRTRTERYAADAPVNDIGDSWRGFVTPADLPTDANDLRSTLRAAIRRAAGDDPELRAFGYDLGVVALTYNLVATAPVDADQRGALLALLATAPEWTTPGTSITPMSIRNLGAATDAEGRDGLRIRVELRFTQEEARKLSVDPEPFALDFVLDTGRGRILEVREFEDGLDARPQVTTIERQEIRPA